MSWATIQRITAPEMIANVIGLGKEKEKEKEEKKKKRRVLIFFFLVFSLSDFDQSQDKTLLLIVSNQTISRNKRTRKGTVDQGEKKRDQGLCVCCLFT